MNCGPFLCGLTLGMAAGAAITCSMNPRGCRSAKKTAHKAVQHMANAVDDLTDALGI